ncbi:polyprenyl synthetase family protein [Actinocrispum sp. NPDC049592]|uniref:polyprenyl synthetase family protein n=1 Tax=Actinocrispum sp. NPDC049592 TaxID=3154835 RepID=UPI00341F892F
MRMVTSQRFPSARAAVEAAGVDLRAELDQVEHGLRATLRDPENPFLSKAATHLIEAGGKRFRPLMVLLGACFGTDRTSVVDAAQLAELVHVATLYHDDVMDEAPVRHGVVSANTRWNNTIAILLGDYLLARAAALAATLGDEAVRLQARTFARLVRGQIDETVGPGKGVDRIGHCLRVMADKSSSLISMAVRLGATVSGAPGQVADALALYGELLGISFQISDDVLDICASEHLLGKQPGTDLREGIVTLPVLYAVEDNPTLAEIVLSGPLTDERTRSHAIALLRESPGLQRAQREACQHAERAKELLYDLPDIPAKTALINLGDFAAGRAF